MLLVINIGPLTQLLKEQGNWSWCSVCFLLYFGQLFEFILYQDFLSCHVLNHIVPSWEFSFSLLYLVVTKDCFYDSAIFVVPEGQGEKTELEVFNFTGEGGVSLAMYNTDEVDSAMSFIGLIGWISIMSASYWASIYYLACDAVYPCFCRVIYVNCLWEKMASLS